MTQVNAIGLEPFCQGNVVIHDKGNFTGFAYGLQWFGQRRSLVLVQSLYPELESGDQSFARVERTLKSVGKVSRNVQW